MKLEVHNKKEKKYVSFEQKTFCPKGNWKSWARKIASIGYAESTDLLNWTNIKQLFTCSGIEANGDKYGCTVHV